MQDKLDVNVNDNFIGTLYKDVDKFIFSYNSQTSEFLSLTMLPRVEQYINDKLHPIFEMNLPEGYLLSIIKKHFSKLTKTDDFGLLKLMSKSVKGRISYGIVKNKKDDFLELNELLKPTSPQLFEELVSRFALNTTLSGVQPKVLATVQNKATLKYNDYIIKSWGDEYPQLALNEYYCMKIVQYAGIEVPEFYISDDYKLFIMKRFDIKDDGSKIGFEDMCVLQAKQRDDKYEGTYEQIAKTIKLFTSPKYKKSSLRDFFKMVVINNIIQNGDAHLKNFGLIYTNFDDIKLSPAYDVVSTTAYIKNDIPALHLLGSKKWWTKKYLLRFGIESCDLKKSEAEKLYNTCVEASKKVKIEIEKELEYERLYEEKRLVLEHVADLVQNMQNLYD